MKPSSLRADGDFGRFYSEPHDVRRVITAYMAANGVGYRAAWRAWFQWALNSEGIV